MVTLTITAKGQVTLKQEVLRHLGLEPGSQVEVDLLPGGKVGLAPVRDQGSPSWADLWASLPSHDGPIITLDQMEAAIAAHVTEEEERIAREVRERRASRQRSGA